MEKCDIEKYEWLKIPIHPETGCKERKGEVPPYKALQQFKVLKHLSQSNENNTCQERCLSTKWKEYLSSIYDRKRKRKRKKSHLSQMRRLEVSPSNLLLLPRPNIDIRCSSKVEGCQRLSHWGGSPWHCLGQANPCQEEDWGEELKTVWSQHLGLRGSKSQRRL